MNYELRIDHCVLFVILNSIFIIPVLSLGEENINKASATIDILGPTNEKLATVKTDEKAVESKNRRDLTAKWKADVNPGVYHAVAVVNYDGKLVRVEKNFGVGNLLIDVVDVKVKNFKLGGIAKFEISLENKWNQKIDWKWRFIVIKGTKLQGKCITILVLT